MNVSVIDRKRETDAIYASAFLAREHFIANSYGATEIVAASNSAPTTIFSTNYSMSGAITPTVTIGNTSKVWMSISNFENDRFFLKAPIVVEVHQDDDGEFIVTLADAELSRSGGTLAEAISWLESSMVELYELFKGEDQLGPLPQRQFRALEQYIGEKPHRAR